MHDLSEYHHSINPAGCTRFLAYVSRNLERDIEIGAITNEQAEALYVATCDSLGYPKPCRSGFINPVLTAPDTESLERAASNNATTRRQWEMEMRRANSAESKRESHGVVWWTRGVLACIMVFTVCIVIETVLSAIGRPR